MLTISFLGWMRANLQVAGAKHMWHVHICWTVQTYRLIFFQGTAGARRQRSPSFPHARGTILRSLSSLRRHHHVSAPVAPDIQHRQQHRHRRVHLPVAGDWRCITWRPVTHPSDPGSLVAMAGLGCPTRRSTTVSCPRLISVSDPGVWCPQRLPPLIVQ